MSTQRTRKSRARRKKLRVLVLMHEDLVPPEDIQSLSESDFAGIRSGWGGRSGRGTRGAGGRGVGVRGGVLGFGGGVGGADPHHTPSLK